MSTKIKPLEFEFLSPIFCGLYTLGSINYRPTLSSPFESGLEHFDITLLIFINHHMTSPKLELRCKAMGNTINLKTQRYKVPKK